MDSNVIDILNVDENMFLESPKCNTFGFGYEYKLHFSYSLCNMSEFFIEYTNLELVLIVIDIRFM